MGKKRRKYNYRGRPQWPRSHRYRRSIPTKFRLIRVGIVLLILTIGFLVIKGKNKEATYDPVHEKITAFEVPPDVSSSIFEEAKNNKDAATLFANYIFGKKPGFLAGKKTKQMYKEAIKCYEQFVFDVDTFPIDLEYAYGYEDSWCTERTYGGTRKHYGTDIMDLKNERGLIPINSMSSGTIENVGWNEMGGYRVGVRTENGAYVYYAHLNEYAPEMVKGAKVSSGNLIGYMGDSGYGAEGTVGKFQVHLHVGIATKALGSNEEWVNPYYILKYLEGKEEALKSREVF